MKNSFPGDGSELSSPKSCRVSPKMSARSLAKKAASAWQGLLFLCGGKPKNFEVNKVEAAEIARASFARLLREPFPTLSDQAVAGIWAHRLDRSEQTVLNWMNCRNAAPIDDVFVVATMHGVWETARIMVGESTRQDLLNKMAQR